MTTVLTDNARPSTILGRANGYMHTNIIRGRGKMLREERPIEWEGCKEREGRNKKKERREEEEEKSEDMERKEKEYRKR